DLHRRPIAREERASPATGGGRRPEHWRGAGGGRTAAALVVGHPGRPFGLPKLIFGRGGAGMLAIIGLVLIALWIIGLAFKVTSGLIHIALVVGLLLVIFNFITGRRATSIP